MNKTKQEISNNVQEHKIEQINATTTKNKQSKAIRLTNFQIAAI